MSENLGKYLLRKIVNNNCSDKPADPQPENWSKKWIHYTYISSNMCTFQQPILQGKPQRRSNNFEFQFIMLLKVYCSSFSAVTVGMFDWSMVKLLRTERRIVSNTIDKEERDAWNLQNEHTQWRVHCMVLDNNIKIAVSVC